MTAKKVPELVDSGGRPVRLGRVIGQGGEGAVYELAEATHLVAKVYNHPMTAERADKIVVMRTLGSDALKRLTAWPVDLLREKQGGAPAGLVLPRVSGRKDIHTLYSPKSRRAEFKRADWRFLVRAAANTARAFAAVHEAGCVIGDVNHGGVLVAQNATVTLIDCDSFEVTYGGRRYPCEVGVETFTPPELQGKSFAGVVRTANHDEFGLAVMTFLLLFMGRHPFAGRYSGAGDMPISRAIEEFRFAYGRDRATVGMMQPPGTPPLSVVGPAVETLFERAFSRAGAQTGRPSARDWITCLSDLEADLSQCAVNSSHWHRRGASCPWCVMEGATGVTLFPTIVQLSAGTSFDLGRLWQEVERIPHPGPLPSIELPSPKPSPEAARLLRWAGKRHGIAAGLATLVLLAAVVIGPVAVLAAGVAYFVVYAALDRSGQLQPYRVAREKARANWDLANTEWSRRASPVAFDDRKAALSIQKGRWNDIPNVRTRKLQELTRDRERVQRERFLDGFEIEKARIEGIGKGRKQVLASYGIETADDVTAARVAQVPGFGPKMQARMLDWRRSLERRFVFDPARAVDPRDVAKVEADVLAERKQIEDDIISGVADLRRLAAQIEAARHHLRPQVEAARRGYLQAQADLGLPPA